MAEPSTRSGTVAGDLGSIAEDTASMAKAEASRRAASAKISMAEEIGGVASAMRKASGEFNDDSMRGKAFRQLADGLNDASESLRNKDFGEVMHGVNRFAREHPATFLGAAALLGFAASRFAVASGSPRDAGQASARPMPAGNANTMTTGLGPSPASPARTMPTGPKSEVRP